MKVLLYCSRKDRCISIFTGQFELWMNFCAVYPQISYDILKLIKYTDVWVPQNQKLILEPKLQEIGINQFDGITEKEQENISPLPECLVCPDPLSCSH